MSANDDGDGFMTGTQARFFDHAGARQQDPRMRNSTRYLCAAAYLDRRFRNRVIEEYIEDEHRAVAPVYGSGYDLEPVIMHCLQARRLVLFRDLAYITVALLALVVAPLPLLIVLFFFAWATAVVWLWRLLPRNRWRIPLFLLLWQVAGFIVWAPLFAAAFVLERVFSSGELESLLDDRGSAPRFDEYGNVEEPGFASEHWLFVTCVLVLVLSLIAFAHVLIVYMIMRRSLYPLSTAAAPGSPSPHVRTLLSRITGAQHGNLTIYSRENPFLGAGDVEAPWTKAWSIVLELDRTGPKASEDAKRVDPAELHSRVWKRLQSMKVADADDPSSLLPNESVVGLERPEMHVIARGRIPQYPRPLGHGDMMYQGHPLIDGSGTPFSTATPEAIDAIIRHPQGALRCYQKIAVDSRGQLVVGRDNAVIAPAEDQDVAMTAFLHVAVEGRMLYAQFVATALTPVRGEFKIVDHLPSVEMPALVWRAFRQTWKTAPSATILAPFRVIRTAWHMGLTAVTASSARPQTMTVHDYGARISPRELAAEPDFDTYLQVLDTDKYIRLIERRINEAVLDYLANECCIDVSAYREQVGAIMNNSVTINGGTINGQINTGAGSTLNQSPTP